MFRQLKLRFAIFFAVSAFAVYIMGLYKHERALQKERAKEREPIATDFLVDFDYNWLKFETWEDGKLIAISRLSYKITGRPVVWTVWR